MPDSLEARRLLQILHQGRTDGHLQNLIRAFTNDSFSVNVPIAVVAGGQLIRGQLATPERFATDIETFLERLIQHANIGGDNPPSSEEDVSRWRQAVIEVFKGSFLQRVTRERRLDTRVGAALDKEWGATDPDKFYDIDELPAPLAKDAIAYLAAESAFALTDAEILVGPVWQRVGTVRVLINQVAAWWLADYTPRPASSGSGSAG
jgi:hypothetical protein